jgi:hypothetical protein
MQRKSSGFLVFYCLLNPGIVSALMIHVIVISVALLFQGMAFSQDVILPISSPREFTSTVVLRFGGDVLLAHRYEESVGADMNRAFRDFGLFRSDDVSMVNLEVPVTNRGGRRIKPFTFRMKTEYLEALTSGGIDIVNIANNHIYDFGKIGLFDTIAKLDSARIGRVGAGRDYAEAHHPVVVTIRNVKIGFLGYYGGHESPAAKGKSAGVAERNLRIIQNDIERLKHEQDADFVVVNFHWGKENARMPDASQQEFAHNVIDAGADAIIGHHPHVLQGIEVYKNKIIAYSLGNLVFGGNGRHSYNTGILEIRCNKDTAWYSFLPVRVSKWRAIPMTGESSEQMLVTMRKLSAIFPKSIFN